MTIQSITRSVSKLSVLALLPAALLANSPAPDPSVMRQGVGLIREVEDAAQTIHGHADRLKTFSRSFQISRGMHANDLNAIRWLVNESLRPALARLEALQPQLPEWKQQNITSMIETARALAADTNSAIVVKRQAVTVPAAMNAEYKALVEKIVDQAASLAKMSDAAESYAAARLKAADAGIAVPTS
jgi:hypothetical protein